MLAMRRSLRGRLHVGLLWEGGLCLARGVPRRVCLPVGRRGLCLLRYLSGEGGRVSLVCWGVGSGRGVLGASSARTGVVFLLVSATSHRLAPPGKGPAPPHAARPLPGAASTIPLICNDFCLFLSFSFSDLLRPLPIPPPRACAGTAPYPSGSVRFRFVC